MAKSLRADPIFAVVLARKCACLYGYDMKRLKKNINTRYAVGNNYKFSQQNFINEAFTEEKEFIRDIDIKTKQQPKKLRIVINHGQGLKINQTSQTHNQII